MAKKKVFISWSGDSSQKVAEALKEWIPSVIQAIDTWVSSLDIKPGSRWSDKIKSELEETSFGIICLTSDNLKSDWIHFEAGALAKSMKGDSEVCPYLFQVKKSQVTGPLSQFQMIEANKEETFKLLDSLNESLREEKLEKRTLEKTFEYMWKELESELNKIHIEGGEKLPVRSDREILEEILELVRGLSRSKTKEYDARGLSRSKTKDYDAFNQLIENFMEKTMSNKLVLDKSDNFYISKVKKSDTDTDKGNCAPAP